MEECRSRVEQALAALAAGANRDARREMKLHAALGASLIPTRGAAGPEIGAAWTKALEIAESLDDTEYRLRSLWGLWSFHISGGQYRVALALAQRFYTLAANRSDPNDRLIGERMIGVSQHYLGDQPCARRYIEPMLTHYVRPLGGQRENDVEIADRQQIGLAGREPILRRCALTLWAMAIAAGNGQRPLAALWGAIGNGELAKAPSRPGRDPARTCSPLRIGHSEAIHCLVGRK
jgi:hypothetical protein